MNSPDSFPAPPNRIDTDPMLVDVGAANFALKTGSPAIGFGVVVPYWQQQTSGDVEVWLERVFHERMLYVGRRAMRARAQV